MNWRAAILGLALVASACTTGAPMPSESTAPPTPSEAASEPLATGGTMGDIPASGDIRAMDSSDVFTPYVSDGTNRNISRTESDDCMAGPDFALAECLWIPHSGGSFAVGVSVQEGDPPDRYQVWIYCPADKLVPPVLGATGSFATVSVFQAETASRTDFAALVTVEDGPFVTYDVVTREAGQACPTALTVATVEAPATANVNAGTVRVEDADGDLTCARRTSEGQWEATSHEADDEAAC